MNNMNEIDFQTLSSSGNGEEEIELEWEEWDGESPFLHHCIAGSIAGVAEHTLLYPVDTVKTHMQAYCSACPNNPANLKSTNLAIKPICTGPPSALRFPTPVTSVPPPSILASVPSATASASASASASSSHAPHGMWSTMTNLINHGHSHGPAGHHNNLTLAAATKATRQSGTLTLPEATAAATATANVSANATTAKPSAFISKGYTRLWRGVQTMTTGCIPAHAVYFASYEYTKDLMSTTTTSSSSSAHAHAQHKQLDTLGASTAGAVSTFFHDLIMTPMDTVKQRMQLGHYESMNHAFKSILKSEGMSGLYRSFGVTVMTNLPYGMIMVSTNEFLRNTMMDVKRQRQQPAQLDLQTTMLAGCGAGMVAAGATAPLDRIKTRLQTQGLASSATKAAAAVTCPKSKMQMHRPQYAGLNDALVSIIKEEGYVGLWRGLAPRLLTHTPAVAISWTAYETAKRWLGQNFEH